MRAFFSFSLLLPGGGKKKILTKQNRKKTCWCNCFLRLWFRDVKYCLFFSFPRQETKWCSATKECEVRSAARSVSWAGVASAHAAAPVCERIYTTPPPPDVVCVSVYVDRDQRWVLEHFRPPALHIAAALTVWDLPLSSPTWHYLSPGATRESMVHCTHRRTISLTVSPRTLPHFLRSAILSPFSVSMHGSLSVAPLPLKKKNCTGELPFQLPVGLNVTNVKCNPEVYYITML